MHYANVFQSGFLRMVVAIMFLLLPVFQNSTNFLSYCEMWKIILSELRQNARYLLICMINCCLMFILNGNKEFHFITIKVVQYNIIIQLFQFNFFSCSFYLTFFHFLCYIYIILFFAIVHFMGLLASDYLTNPCNYCSIFWVMIVCEEIFVYLQTIWQGCVGVPSLLHECSISLWSEYVSVLVLMLVYLQIWWEWVIALWAKIGRDIGKLFNLKLLFLQFLDKRYFYDIFLTLPFSVSKTIM